jgi:hypothetical protein
MELHVKLRHGRSRLNKTSTRDYTVYRVGDLILYKQNDEKTKDLGWIKSIIDGHDDDKEVYIIQWRNSIVNKITRCHETNETIASMSLWDDSYVVSSNDD